MPLKDPLLPPSLSSSFPFPSFLPSFVTGAPGLALKTHCEEFLAVQWLGLDAFTATGPSSVPAGEQNPPAKREKLLVLRFQAELLSDSKRWLPLFSAALAVEPPSFFLSWDDGHIVGLWNS